MDDRHSSIAERWLVIMHQFWKNVAEAFYRNITGDLTPDSMAQMVDFGLLDSGPIDQEYGCFKALYLAYHSGIRSGKITAAELDDAVGDGAKLTVLVQRIDPSLVVKTPFDMMGPPEDE